MPYRSRHTLRGPSAPPLFKYNMETRKAYSETPLAVDEEDEATLKTLGQRLREDIISQAEREQMDAILARREERVDARCAPLAREIEGYTANLNLPALPPPLPKSSSWFSITRVEDYRPAEVRPFYVACLEGSLDVVKEWVAEKKDVLRPLGIRDGLDIAAMGAQVDVVRFLLKEAGAEVSACAVMYAAGKRSLALFKLFLENEYHPDQQAPCNKGHFGTALRHCLDSDAIALLLLENGADPNVAPIMDGRRGMWSERAAVPMDRKSGLPLDEAMGRSSIAVIRKLLECGATPKYSRPLERILRDRGEYVKKQGIEDDWQVVMDLLLSYGADVNAKSWGGGTALGTAVRQSRWDVVGFLLDHGADPRVERMDREEDVFETAAKAAGVPWEFSTELRDYLDCLCGEGDGGVEAPGGAGENPLVRFMEERKAKSEEARREKQAE